MSIPWWREAVFYQIYPRSYKDSNGDGIGDLEGIRSKLEYLSWLGVDALWISPFFPSPMKDFGYDVADYRAVDPRFGTMDDCIALVKAAKARGLKIILDLVANHSSDEHQWFIEARAAKQSAHHDWYIWSPRQRGIPNNWKAIFELKTAWHPNEQTDEYYLGTFTKHQPEFDWRNPGVREEFYDIMLFWYGLGVDGFRLDVATAYAKDPELRSNPLSFVAVPDFFQRHIHDRNHPDYHGIFKEMRSVADAKASEKPGASLPGQRVLIGEPHGQSLELSASCYGYNDDELHLAFNFDFLDQKWDAGAFRQAAEAWYRALLEHGWPSLVLSNHDKPRHIWRYRSADKELTLERAKVAAAMLLCLKGSPFLYYGEEIGMNCHRLARKDLRDPLGINTWPLGFLGRDPSRRPMQWDAGDDAGFGSAQPWLPFDPEWRACNVAAQRGDPDSLLEWYRALLTLRRASTALRRGSLRFIQGPKGLLAWERILPAEAPAEGSEYAAADRSECETAHGSEHATADREPVSSSVIRVFLNFRSEPIKIQLDEPFKVLISNRRKNSVHVQPGSLVLEASEALIGESTSL